MQAVSGAKGQWRNSWWGSTTSAENAFSRILESKRAERAALHQATSAEKHEEKEWPGDSEAFSGVPSVAE